MCICQQASCLIVSRSTTHVLNFLFFLFAIVHPPCTHPLIHPSIHTYKKKKNQALLSGFESEAKSLGAKADAVAAATKDIRAGLERGMQGLRAHNGTVLGRHLKTAVKEARSERKSTRVNRKDLVLWCLCGLFT